MENNLARGVSRFLVCFGVFVLAFCALAFNSLAYDGGCGKTHYASVKRSAKTQGIKFTLDKYAVENNKLIVFYSVKSPSDSDEKINSLIENPDIHVANKLIRGNLDTFRKVGKGQYKGRVEANLPENIGDRFKVSFNTDSILNKEGQWTVHFKVK